MDPSLEKMVKRTDQVRTPHMKYFLTSFKSYDFFVIVITRAEDIMADNSPSPRAQPEDEYYYRHHIRGNGL